MIEYQLGDAVEASLLYRFGIAFYRFYVLLKIIGPEKTSYNIVLFPIGAVILSTIFETFKWTEFTFMGFILVGLGNILVLTPCSKIKRLLAFSG